MALNLNPKPLNPKRQTLKPGRGERDNQGLHVHQRDLSDHVSFMQCKSDLELHKVMEFEEGLVTKLAKLRITHAGKAKYVAILLAALADRGVLSKLAGVKQMSHNIKAIVQGYKQMLRNVAVEKKDVEKKWTAKFWRRVRNAARSRKNKLQRKSKFAANRQVVGAEPANGQPAEENVGDDDWQPIADEEAVVLMQESFRELAKIWNDGWKWKSCCTTTNQM